MQLGQVVLTARLAKAPIQRSVALLAANTHNEQVPRVPLKSLASRFAARVHFYRTTAVVCCLLTGSIARVKWDNRPTSRLISDTPYELQQPQHARLS